MDTAKIFWNGRSQAVRLPKAFRIDATEVRVRRHGSGIILEPVPDNWTWLDSMIGPLDDDLVAAAAEQPPAPERPDLDFLP